MRPATLRTMVAAGQKIATGWRALARAAPPCPDAVVTGSWRSGAVVAVSRAGAGAAAVPVEPLPDAFRPVNGKIGLQRAKAL
jgi:hypothetical protein